MKKNARAEMLKFKKQSWPIFPKFRALFYYGYWKSSSDKLNSLSIAADEAGQIKISKTLCINSGHSEK